MQPLVSIIIPCFNRSHLIGETLDSIIDQTYSNWECIVIDDGSTDYTEEIMEFYCTIDERIKFFSRPVTFSKGANSCRNFGFKKSEGDFIKFFDSDDLLIQDALSVQTEHFKQNLSIDVSIAYVNYFHEKIEKSWKSRPSKLSSEDLVFDYVVGNIFLSTGGPLWKRKFLETRKVLFNENLFRLQDTEFYYRIILDGLNFEFLDRAVVNYRYNTPGAITLNSTDKNLDSVFKYWFFVLGTARCKNHHKDHILRLFVVNNLSILYHRMLLNHDSIKSRYRTARAYFGDLRKALHKADIPVVIRTKILFGIAFTLIYGKGLRFFRIPQKN